MVTTFTSRDERIAESASRLRLAIVRTARRMRQEAGGELSPSMVAALATIDRHGPLTPSELADMERIKRPTATRIAAKLEGEGLIVRAPDPTDGRGSLLSSSADGRELMKRMRKRKNAYLSKRIRPMADEDLTTLENAAEILERMLADTK